MTEKPPAIEITIERSTVHGDVVAGDKTTVHVHLHPDQLSSAKAIERALAEQETSAGDADRLIRRLLDDSDLLARFDEARKTRNVKDVERELDEVVKEYERLGGSTLLIERLLSAVDASRKLRDWTSFARAASAYLAITYNAPERAEVGMALSDELVSVSLQDSAMIDYVPIARICQARLLYLQYTVAALEIRTALGIRSALPLHAPLLNLLDEHKEALGYLRLADEYAREALDIAFDRARPGVVIFVLFGFVALQEHAHFHQRYSMERDAHELVERVRRGYQILEQMIDRFGSVGDKAILHSNLANFWRQTCEYQKAEVLATAAARTLSTLGDANGARRALDVAQLAREQTPVARRPTDADIAALTTEQIEAMMREASARLLKLHGIDDSEPGLREALELAWTDFNPERVLRCCDQIEISNETSDLGKLVAVPTLGMKRIACAKFHRRIESPSLDRGFETFKTALGCEACPYRARRSADWRWGWIESDDT